MLVDEPERMPELVERDAAHLVVRDEGVNQP